jgi:uncharacterized protein (TIGR02246 family)
MKTQWCMTVLACCCLALLSASCIQKQQPPPDTRAADERAIREADSAWSAAEGAKDLDRALSFYAPDASVFRPNAPIITGVEAIRKSSAQDFAAQGWTLSWKAAKVEVSLGGNLGYAFGTYEFTSTPPKGKPVTDRGKYLTVWKKQPDGKWKAVADMFSSDLPATPPSK